MTKSCPICSKHSPDSSKFCKFCGTALTCSCPQCGRDNDVDSRFCLDCGGSLGASGGAGADGSDSEPHFSEIGGRAIAGNVVYEALAFKALCSQYELTQKLPEEEESSGEESPEEIQGADSWKGVPFPFTDSIIRSVLQSRKT